ncbi:MAG: DNA-binding response regulator [Fusobacteriia bacterium 4572_132]|nr:MAG: DNA-binding response regulator [Fusobacteriia bacterium 4572_132]
MKKILIVEDDIEIRNLLEYFLKKGNYEIFSVGDGLKALKMIRNEKPDLILLDIMLPSLNGIDLAKLLNENEEEYGEQQIIMMSAKTEVEDVIEGLESGANDYIRKPFDPREVLARVKKTLKDKKNKEILNYKRITMDLRKYLVLEEEKEINLSQKEYALLKYLIENKGIVVTRNKILDKIWGSDYYPGDRTVDVYIGKLREKLKTISKEIKTVKGVGYKLKSEK